MRGDVISGSDVRGICCVRRGVLQSLIEKHFPAPNRKKMADLFKLDADSDGSERKAPPVPGPKKRKRAKKGDERSIRIRWKRTID